MMSEKNFNNDNLKYDWDDTEILNVFNNAVKSHRTKNNQNNVKKKSDAPEVNLCSDSTNMCNTTASQLPQSSNKGDTIIQKRKVELLSQSNIISSERRVGTSSKKSVPDLSTNDNNNEPESTSCEPISSTAVENGGSFSSNNIDLPTSSNIGDESGGNPATIANPNLDINNSFNSMLMAWYQSGYATGYYVAEQHYLNAQKKDSKS